VVVGGIAEIRDTVRGRRATALVSGGVGPEERPDVADLGRWPMLAWFGLSAFAILGTASVADRRPDVDDLMFIVLMLGFAGDRAFYLVRRRKAEDAALGGDVLSLVVGAIGLLVGFTI
jgi:hypothetical protein